MARGLIARVTLIALLCASSASAQETPNEAVGGVLSEADEDTLDWWPWALSVPLFGMALTIEAAVDADDIGWRRVGPVDESFRPWVRATRAGRERADLASDIFLYSMFAAPVLDAVLWRDGQSPSRDAYRLLATDALAFSVQTLVVVATKVGFRRARPYDEGCRADPDYAPECDSDSRYRGFISGHTSASFTGASLVCAHQRLRGLSALGRVECVASLVLASLTGALRIVSERHYLSDVIAGAAVGFLSGFVFPVFVYPRSLPRPEPPAPLSNQRAW